MKVQAKVEKIIFHIVLVQENKSLKNLSGYFTLPKQFVTIKNGDCEGLFDNYSEFRYDP